MPVTGAPPANGHTVRRPCKQPCWCLIEVLKDWAQQNQASAFWQTGEAASLLPISSLPMSARPAWTVHLFSGCRFVQRAQMHAHGTGVLRGAGPEVGLVFVVLLGLRTWKEGAMKC